jgi:hypothetical protein
MSGRIRLVAAVAIAVISFFALTPAASAHDPIFLSEDQDSPDTGPYLPDGTISFAVYGSLLTAGDTRGLEFDLREGDELYLSLLIPDLEPEISLADGDLPSMTLIEPDGAERIIEAEVRTPFADPFSGTNYVTLFETVQPAAGGRYQILVSGQSPSRFVVAVGTREEFFTPTERSGDKPDSFPAIAEPLNEWYTTPADGSEQIPTGDDAEVDVDEEMIDEALEELDRAEAGDEVGTQTDATQADAQAAASTGDPDDGGDGASTTWIAPALVAIAAAVGGAAFMVLRRRTA